MSDNPVRILRLIARLNVGGPSLHVSYLSEELDRCGYETLLAAGRVGAGEGSMEYVTTGHGVEPVYIDDLQRNINPVGDALAARKVLQLIREFRPDILHTHTAKAGAIGRSAAQLAGRQGPKVVVHTFHGHVLRGYFNPAVTAAFRQVERALARSTDALIAVSPEVRDDLIELGIAPPERIAVVRLGLDLDERTAAPPASRAAVRTSLGVGDDQFLVGWLGRMTEVKRVDDLLGSFAELRSRGVDAALALVGDGPLRGQMERIARQLGIDDHCHFIGYRDEVGPLYAAFDAVALTSANEGTPVTLIESLAARVPVVATNVGGVSDVVPDGEGGFLVPIGDTSAVAERLQLLAGDAGLRARFGEHGSEFVRARYSVPRLVTDMDELYQKLLARAQATEVARRLTAPIPSSFPPAVRTRIAPAPRRLRILLVSQYFPPEIGATQSRMQAFAEYLAERGHDVTVIAEFPNHPQGVIPDRYRGHLIEDDRSNPYRVLRVWVKTSAVKDQRSRLAFYGSFTALAAAVGPLAGRADVVVATSPPLFTGLTGTALSRFNRAPFVLDVRDLWPAAAEALEQISGTWVGRLAGGLERWLYRQADVVVAVTKPFCSHVDELRARTPAAVLIPNGTLELFFDANGGSAERSSLSVPQDGFLVTFAGTHGIAQPLSPVLETAALVGDRFHFLFVGEGPMKESLRDEAARRKLRNVSFHEQVPTAQIPRILAASDALLVPLSAHRVFGDFVPSKMIDFMAVGRPVILSAHGESARLLERAQAGVVAAPEDPDSLAQAAEWLEAHPAESKVMGERGREFARRRLRVVQAQRLEQVLLDVASR